MSDVIYETKPGVKWQYGEETGRLWHNGVRWLREGRLYGPCPQCGTQCSSYGGGWRCDGLYCCMSRGNSAPSMGPQPSWWNTDVRVFMDGNSWCAIGAGFTNLQESHAGFGSTPAEAVAALNLPPPPSEGSHAP